MPKNDVTETKDLAGLFSHVSHRDIAGVILGMLPIEERAKLLKQAEPELALPYGKRQFQEAKAYFEVYINLRSKHERNGRRDPGSLKHYYETFFASRDDHENATHRTNEYFNHFFFEIIFYYNRCATARADAFYDHLLEQAKHSTLLSLPYLLCFLLDASEARKQLSDAVGIEPKIQKLVDKILEIREKIAGNEGYCNDYVELLYSNPATACIPVFNGLCLSSLNLLIQQCEKQKSLINLSGADLSGADLRGVNLRGVNLRGVNLSGADLSGADLRGVNLSGADLRGASLRGASLRGMNLRGANLRGMNLSGMNLSGMNLSGADLSEVNLSGADLSGADLSWADLREVNLNGPHLSFSSPSWWLAFHEADLPRVSFRGANLHGVNLSGVNLSGVDLRGVDLSEEDLRWVEPSWEDLREARLRKTKRFYYKVDFREAHLSEANLRGADLRGVNLRGVNLRGADLSWTQLNGASFFRANLSRANLSGADLGRANCDVKDIRWVDFRGADLSGADFSGRDLRRQKLYYARADFREANLSEANLSSMIFDRSRPKGGCRMTFRGADLSGANLSEAKFYCEVDFRGVNLRGANLSRAQFCHEHEVDFRGVNLRGANLSWAKFYFGVDLREIKHSLTDFTGIRIRSSDLPPKLTQDCKLMSTKIEIEILRLYASASSFYTIGCERKASALAKAYGCVLREIKKEHLNTERAEEYIKEYFFTDSRGRDSIEKIMRIHRNWFPAFFAAICPYQTATTASSNVSGPEIHRPKAKETATPLLTAREDTSVGNDDLQQLGSETSEQSGPKKVTPRPSYSPLKSENHPHWAAIAGLSVVASGGIGMAAMLLLCPTPAPLLLIAALAIGVGGNAISDNVSNPLPSMPRFFSTKANDIVTDDPNVLNGSSHSPVGV